MTVVNSSFTDNSTSFCGGAVDVRPTVQPSTTPQLIVQSSNFVGNQAGYGGGAIHDPGATARFRIACFRSNQVVGISRFHLAAGGAISAEDYIFSYPANQNIPLAVTKCTFIDNQASLSTYSGLRCRPGRGYLESDCDDRHRQHFLRQFRRERHGPGRGHRRRHGFRGHHRPFSFVGNQAVGQYNGASGGAIYTALQEYSLPPTTTDIIASSFTDNTAMGVGQNTAGGAIADAPYVPSFPGNSLTITGTTFSGNQAVGSPSGGSSPLCAGRRIYSPGRPLSISSSSFVDNQAIGIKPSVRIRSTGRRRPSVGRSMYQGPSVSIDRSNFQDNVAQGGASDSGGGAAAGGALELGILFGESGGRRLQLDIRRQSGRKWIRRRRLLPARSGGRRDRRPLWLPQPVECQCRG